MFDNECGGLSRGVELSIISKPPPEHCVYYYSKRKYPNQHKTDQVTQDILSNKHAYDTSAGERIAEMMDRYVVKHEYLVKDVALIIPVPNYGSSTNCKAPLIANLLAEKIRKRSGKNIHSYPDVLKRSNKTWQRRRGPTERRLSAETDYQISDYIKNNNNLLKDNRLLLVDDIITTGYTAAFCQDLLYDNGASSVAILCAAETLQ